MLFCCMLIMFLGLCREHSIHYLIYSSQQPVSLGLDVSFINPFGCQEMTTNSLSNKDILNKEIGHPTVDSACQGYYQECRLLHPSPPSSSECWLFIHRFVASWSQDGDCDSRHHNPMQQHSKQKGGKGAGIYSQLLLSFSLEKNHSQNPLYWLPFYLIG